MLLIKSNLVHHWGKIPLEELAEKFDITLFTLLETAFDKGLSNIETPNVSRRWTKSENQFLEKYSTCLDIKEASNLLYRSHYATYQHIRVLGLDNMIKKKVRK